MAKIVIQHEEDPEIAIILAETGPALGWYGNCTQCGRRMHRWDQSLAILSAQQHVNRHEAGSSL